MGIPKIIRNPLTLSHGCNNLIKHYQGWDLTIEALGRFNQHNNLMFHILLPCLVVKFVLITLQETLICDRASKKGPSGHKLHLIIKQ